MKCSDCKLWKTDECKNNPDAKGSDCAETFACFKPSVEQESAQSAYFVPPVEQGLTSYFHTRRSAIVSLVCGILGIVIIPYWSIHFHLSEIGFYLSPFLGLIGIVIGAIYLKAIKKAPNRGGRAMAIIGIICGSISVIVFGLNLIYGILLWLGGPGR
jgi:hypothetical protein